MKVFKRIKDWFIGTETHTETSAVYPQSTNIIGITQTGNSNVLNISSYRNKSLSDNEDNPFILWAEIQRLRSRLQGPQGFESWQDAATDERIRRVKAERDLKAERRQNLELPREGSVPNDANEQALFEASFPSAKNYGTWPNYRLPAGDWLLGWKAGRTYTTQSAAVAEVMEPFGYVLQNDWRNDGWSLFKGGTKEQADRMRQVYPKVHMIYTDVPVATSQETKDIPSECQVPPEGWYCTRTPGHEGPCAAHPEK